MACCKITTGGYYRSSASYKLPFSWKLTRYAHVLFRLKFFLRKSLLKNKIEIKFKDPNFDGNSLYFQMRESLGQLFA